MAGTVGAWEEYAMIMDEVHGMKAANNGLLRNEENLKIKRVVSEFSLSSVIYFLENLKDSPGRFSEDCIPD